VERERDIQNFNAVASYSIAEFTNETENHLRQTPKKFQY
jgi:hypothetical protein